MDNNKKKFTKLTLEQDDIKIVWEVPYEDVTTADMMQAIRTLMIGITFSDKSVEEGMVNYLYAHSDKYDIIEKEDDKFGYDYETQGLDAGFPSPDEYNITKPYEYE